MEASHTIEQLSVQLKQARRLGSLASLQAPQSHIDELQKSVADLKCELEVEMRRREEVSGLVGGGGDKRVGGRERR